MTNDDMNRSQHDDPHAPPGPHTLPAPLISKEVYRRDKCKWLPLDIDRFARSMFMRIANNEQLGAAFRLWLLAWGERPAGSLPNNDRWLSDAAKILTHAGRASLRSCSTALRSATTAGCTTQ
jgi:hypothetical protein